MSFNTSPGRIEYTASAGQTVFPFAFKIYANTDIKVYQTLAGLDPNDITDILILTTDYTVTINGDLGGEITLVSAAAINDAITIVRDLPVSRPIEYQTNGDLLASTLNQDQDYQTYLISDQADKNALNITLQESTQSVSNILPVPNATKLLGWNSTASGLQNYTVGPDDTLINVLNVDSIADLLLVSPTVYSTVNVRGYYTANDGGGGIFNYDATQSAVNNGGTIIDGWVRQYYGAVDMSWFGVKGDGTDETAIIQNIFNLFTNVIETKGLTYLITGISIIKDKSTFKGTNRSRGTTFKAFTGQVNGVLITVYASQCELQDFLVEGNSGLIEIGDDITTVGIRYLGDTNGNADAHLKGIVFLYLRTAIDIRSRNIKVFDCGFSGCGYGILGDTTELDIRGWTLTSLRFHGMSKTNSAKACIYINPTSNIFDVEISNIYADNCETFYKGYSGNTLVNNITLAKSRGESFLINSTGSTLDIRLKEFHISTISYSQAHPDTTTSRDGFSAVGTFTHFSLNDYRGIGSGRHGVYCDLAFAVLSNISIYNAGQEIDNTYSCIYLASNAIGCQLSSIGVFQNRLGYSPANKAKYGFEIYGTACTVSGLKVSNFVSNGYFLDPSALLQGTITKALIPHIEWNSAIPTTGTWTRGDIIYNIAPTASGFIGWVCITSGVPGAWKTFGPISA